jgi:hypothetical protein
MKPLFSVDQAVFVDSGNNTGQPLSPNNALRVTNRMLRECG